MIISVASGSSGWGNYVINGTNQKPRNQNLIELIDGDIALGDTLSKNNKYEDSYYTFVLGFEGKPTPEQIQSAYEDFKKHMFVGLKEDEYHIDSVIHRDTDDTHIHCRVPKQNLKTNTHLQLYYDKIDRPRKELIQDYISLKNGWNIAREQNREIVKEQKDEKINEWRSERNQEPFNFAKKADKQLAEAEINKYIIELHQAQLINNTDDIKEVLENLDLKVERFGTDLKKDFSYVTISDDNGKKLRIKGEIYNDKFYENTRADREKQIRDNKRDFGNTESREVRLKQVQTKLRNANEKRYSRVTELFAASRARADERLSKVVQNIENKIPIDNSNTLSSDRNIDRHELQIIREPQSNTSSRIKRETNQDAAKKSERIKNELIRTTITETAKQEQEERNRIIAESRKTEQQLQTRIKADINSSTEQFIRDAKRVHESIRTDAKRVHESIRADITRQSEIKSYYNNQSKEDLEQAGRITETASTRSARIADSTKSIKGLKDKSGWYSRFTDKFNEFGNTIERAREQIIDYIKTKFDDVSKSFYDQTHHKKEIAEDFREYNLKAENNTLTKSDVHNSIEKHNYNLKHSNLVEAEEKTRQQSQSMGYSR